MRTIQKDNKAEAYIEGMLWAAYGVKVISGNVEEWQRLTNINYIEFSEEGRNGFYLGKK